MALLPVAVMAGYSYFTVYGMLAKEAKGHVEHASRLFGLALIDRLNLQARLLENLAKTYPAQTDRSGGLLRNLRPASSPPDAAALRRLDAGRVVLRFGSDTPPQLSMLVRQPSTQRLLLADLNAQPLWHNEMMPEHACVFTQQRQMLFCSPTLNPSAVASALPPTEGHAVGSFEFDQGGERFLAGYWNVGLQGVLGNSGLVIVTAEKHDQATGVLEAFKQFYIALALLALGLAAWGAVTQIRRQLSPLTDLMDSARSLAAGNFEVRAKAGEDDEFGQVAEAFNRMAAALDDKFHMQETLATLDRAVLNATIIDDVIRVLLEHLPGAIHADGMAIVHFAGRDRGTLYTPERMEELDAEAVSEYMVLADRIDQGSWLRLDRNDLTARSCLDRSRIPQACETLGIDIYHNTRCIGMLLLGFRQWPTLQDETIHAVRALIERLPVAAARLAAEEALRYQAHHDALTDLPNRSLLRDRVEQAIERSTRNSTVTALLLADLDNFKRVNDSLGHTAGDVLLQACAQRLAKQVRASDTVARLGGDEYVILLPDMERDAATDRIKELVRTLNRVLGEPMEIGGRKISTQASIGIALYPEDADNFDDLLKMADAAMYEAKRDPRSSFRWYAQDMNAEVSERFDLTQDLRTAIENDEMVLHYQPKISLDDDSICGAEALVRWQSPTRGLVAPNLFIPLLDEMGLGDLLGEWVIGKACKQMSAWDRQGFPPIPVAVNIGTSQFLDVGLCDKVLQCLEQYGLRPERLEIEILESAMVSESPAVRENFKALREIGVSIALDDFGTGYSSLSYLTDLPANGLKLDRSFIFNLTADARQQAIVERIIALAKALGLTVVAEGVEEEAQRLILKQMDCDSFQGYLYSRALPAADFGALLQRASVHVQA